MSIYDDCIAAGLEIDHHESDLYIKDSPEAFQLLLRHKAPVLPFTSKIDNCVWYDVPFAWDPFWPNKEV